MERLLGILAIAIFVSSPALGSERCTDGAIKPSVVIQSWGGWVGDDALLSNGDLMQEPGFRLRRARFGVAGKLGKITKYSLELDVLDQERTGGPLHEAWVEIGACNCAKTRIGVQKLPFMKSELFSSSRLSFLDRSSATMAMSPAHAMGLTLSSSPWKDKLNLSLGVFNALRRTDHFYGGYEGVGMTLGNRYEGLAYVGHIELEPFGTLGDSVADRKSSTAFLLGLGGSGFYNDGSSITTLGYSAYLHMKFAGFHLFGEWASDTASPTKEPTSLETINSETGRQVFNVQTGYMILPGTLGIAIRGELIDDNVDEDEHGDEMIISGTGSYYFNDGKMSLQLEYSHRREVSGPTLDNDHVMVGLALKF